MIIADTLRLTKKPITAGKIVTSLAYWAFVMILESNVTLSVKENNLPSMLAPVLTATPAQDSTLPLKMVVVSITVLEATCQ